MAFNRFLVLFFCFVAIGLEVSAAKNAKVIENDSTVFNHYAKSAEQKLNQGSLDSAAFYIQQLNKMANASKTITHKIAYLRVYAILLSRKSQPKASLKIAEELLRLSLQHKDLYKIADAYHILATVQKIAGRLDEAATNVIKALKTSEGLTNTRAQSLYYYNLGNIFFYLREPQKALFYANKGYLLAKGLRDPDLISAYRLRISMNEMLAGNISQALSHLRESEKLFLQKKDVDQLSDTYLYFSHVYFEKKDYHSALSYLKKIQPLLPYVKVQRERFLTHVECAMAETYTKLGDYKNAKYYFERNIGHIKKDMDANDIREMYHIGAVIYENTGDLQTSLSYLKKHKIVSDSVSNVLKKKAVYDIETKYQTTIKEKAIAEQKLQLANKNNELQQKNKYIFFGIIVFVVLILGAAIIYLIYRNRNQATQLSLLKAQIHPHFLFNTLNNLYALTLNKANEAPAVVLGLASILRYILYECNTLKADLQKEMDIIKAYISLEQTRYKHRLEVNVNIEGELNHRQIAPLLILPLVENAFKHGVGKLLDDAWINIDAKIKGDKFIFKIANNKPEKVTTDSDSLTYGNIGLLNIKRRLDILYPKKHSFKISSDDEMFLVIMELSL